VATSLGPLAVSRIDSESALLFPSDAELAEAVGPAVQIADHLRQWWEAGGATGPIRSFPLATTFNAPDRADGFFADVPFENTTLSVMGVAQEMRYDEPKSSVPARWHAEFREFVLRYFLRITAFEQPQPIAQPRTTRSEYENVLSWCPPGDEALGGFGYSQLLYKRARSGDVGRFRVRDRFSILDLRDIAANYMWVVLSVRVFNFAVTFRPFGPMGLSIAIPMDSRVNVAIAGSFVVNHEYASGQVLADYGFGYAIVPQPGSPTTLNYGPGKFAYGFQQVVFRMMRSGEIRVRLTFIVDRPTRILNLSITPLAWFAALTTRLSFGLSQRLLRPFEPLFSAVSIGEVDPLRLYIDLLSWLTGGRAADQWCIAWETLELEMLMQHFIEHYRMIESSLTAWRHVPNWLDAASPPVSQRARCSLDGTP
jgi:hypothetical protein